jgi:hypothetical protein
MGLPKLIQDIETTYLPKNGGEITGTLSFSNNSQSVIRTTSDAYKLDLYGGTAYDSGGWLYLSGNESNATYIPKGSFLLRSSKNSSEYGEICGDYVNKGVLDICNFSVRINYGEQGFLIEPTNSTRLRFGNNYDEFGQFKDRLSTIIICSSKDTSIANRIYIRSGDGETSRDVVYSCNPNDYPITYSSNMSTDTSFKSGHIEISNESYETGSGYGRFYKKYADGYVEQGGWVSGTNMTITFHIPFIDTNYIAIVAHNGTSAKGEGVIHAYNKTTTSMNTGLSINASDMSGLSWFCYGRWK